MGNKVVSIIIVLIIIVGGFLLFRNESVAPIDLSNGDVLPVEPDGGMGDTQPDREYVVNAENFSFSPTTMTARAGETVRITLRNTEGTHDLRIDKLGVNTGVMTAVGEEVVVEFVALEAGTYEYYCSVGNHRELGMAGTLTIEE